MSKIMLINVTHAEESRVGILHDGKLEAFEIESLGREHLKGNIYKGTVHRIHPALEAAFVDIGAERDAFLPLDEICFRNLPHPPANGGGNGKRRLRIRDVLRSGEEIVVQIAKESFGKKPPTLTTYHSLPGRYLVLLPGSDEAGISRRIEGEERNRLRALISELKPPEGFGLIVRTAAAFDNTKAELERDLAYLLRLWENIQATAQTKRAPALVYREQDIVLRTIRDFFTPDIDEIYIDNEEVYLRARQFLSEVMPGREHVLRLFQGEQPIFSAFDVEQQFESIFKRRVPLSSGGHIVIDSTEALTAIDVNSGGSVRSANPEETAFRTNREAAIEIARQLRLRDIGGLIVIDFIDMRDAGHVHEIEKTMREAMRMDKARHEVGRISRFGLLEISRQRLRPAAMASTYMTCPMCEGHGAVRTTESAALVALRKIHHRVALGDVAAMRVTLPTEVALYLLNQKREDLAQLESRYRIRIQVKLSDELMPHQVEIDATMRPSAETAEILPGTVAAPEAAVANGSNGATNAYTAAGSGAKKRRRRRRGKGGLRAAMAIADALSALSSRLNITHPATTSGTETAELATVEELPSETKEVQKSRAESTGKRRSRRGGQGRRKKAQVAAILVTEEGAVTEVAAAVPPEPEQPTPAAPFAATTDPLVPTTEDLSLEEKPKRRRASRSTKKPKASEVAEDATAAAGKSVGRKTAGTKRKLAHRSAGKRSARATTKTAAAEENSPE